MTEYKKDVPQHVIFPKQYINLPLGKVIESVGLRQLRIAETEKYPHVTYFFNGGMPVMYSKEDRILIPSPNVPTYDLQPEMSTAKLMDILIQRIESDAYDFILLNFANPDMVGHTGNLDACVKAVQTVDEATRELVTRFTSRGGAVIITADHGNVEEVINLETGEIDTEHSLNPVPLIIAGTENSPRMLQYGSLSDVAPTVLDIMGITKPSEMTGGSLLRQQGS
jgi:2,3-bisphosphoglycerate-independent phosphoglycerate mutase